MTRAPPVFSKLALASTLRLLVSAAKESTESSPNAAPSHHDFFAAARFAGVFFAAVVAVFSAAVFAAVFFVAAAAAVFLAAVAAVFFFAVIVAAFFAAPFVVVAICDAVRFPAGFFAVGLAAFFTTVFDAAFRVALPLPSAAFFADFSSYAPCTSFFSPRRRRRSNSLLMG